MSLAIDISLPDSYVKSPGFLLRDKKKPTDVKVNQKYIQTLVNRFNSQVEVMFNDGQDLEQLEYNETCEDNVGEISAFYPKRLETCPSVIGLRQTKSRGGLGMVYESTDMEQIQENDQEETITCTSKMAKEIFHIYGIELVDDSSNKDPQAYFSLIGVLISEICSFSSQFFRKLRINKLYITDKIKVESAHLLRENCLCLDILDTTEKVFRKLYQIVFRNMLVVDIKILRDWVEVELAFDRKTFKPTFEQLEELFVALMCNKNHAITKPQPKRLKKILEKHFPGEICEDWFRGRNKERKKLFRVKFDMIKSLFS